MISFLDILVLIFSFQCVLASPVPLSARFPGSTFSNSDDIEQNGRDAIYDGEKSTSVMSLSLSYSPLSTPKSESNTRDGAKKGQLHSDATTEVIVTQTVLTTVDNNAQHKPTQSQVSPARSTKLEAAGGTTFASFPTPYQTPSLEGLSSQTPEATKKSSTKTKASSQTMKPNSVGSNHTTATRTMHGTGSIASIYPSSLTPVVLTTLVPVLSPVATTATYTPVPLKSTPSWVEPEPSTTSLQQSATATSTPCPEDPATSLKSSSSTTATLTLTSTVESTATVKTGTTSSAHPVNQVAATVITIATTITKHDYTATAEATVTATLGKS